MKTVTTKWPKVSFFNKFGKEESGFLAYKDKTESVIRVARPPKLVATNYGMESLDFEYLTVKNEYLILINFGTYILKFL